MLTKLKLTVAAGFLRSTLNSLATSKDTQTTVAGMLAAAVMAIKGLDIGKLLAGDPQQIALVTSGLAVALVGFLATKENHDGHTTLLGAVAAAAQASVGNFTAAIAMALCGYFTNKTVTTSEPVDTWALRGGAVTATQIANATIGTAQIANGAITTGSGAASTYAGPTVAPAKES